MEFTIPFPWQFFSPTSRTDHLDESIINGTFAISGSEAINLKKCDIADSESSRPSSIFISIIWAPFSICCLATDSASSYLSSLINRLKREDPVTFVLSPTLIKFESGRIVIGSSPLNFV